jgi:methionyl-tRNA formyltransferase
LDRVVRVGGAWTTADSTVLKVHETCPVKGTAIPGKLNQDLVGTGDGLLQLLVVQPEGKTRLNATAWLNGARLGPDMQLGT